MVTFLMRMKCFSNMVSSARMLCSSETVFCLKDSVVTEVLLAFSDSVVFEDSIAVSKHDADLKNGDIVVELKNELRTLA